VFIFLVSIYGTAIVRKVAVILSVLIVGGLLAVFIPNIVSQWEAIASTISHMSATPAPVWPAVWSMIVYAAFQIASSPAIHSQHAEVLVKPSDSVFTYVLGFIINSAMILLSTIGILAIVETAEYASASVPVLILLQKGVGGALLLSTLSLLIILGAVSTAVNMVAAGTTRICYALDKNYNPDAKPTQKVVFVTLILSFLGFGVAQFGLLPLVNRGYGILGWLTFPVIMIPYIVHAFYTRLDTKDTTNKNS
jgi:uncharacterized membrane protein YkvI